MRLTALASSMPALADPVPCNASPALRGPLSAVLASSYLPFPRLSQLHQGSQHQLRRRHHSQGLPFAPNAPSHGSPQQHSVHGPSESPHLPPASAQPEGQDGVRLRNAPWHCGGRPLCRSLEQIMEGYGAIRSDRSLGDPHNGSGPAGSRAGLEKVSWHQRVGASFRGLEQAMEGYGGTQSKCVLGYSEDESGPSGSLYLLQIAALSRQQGASHTGFPITPWHQRGRLISWSSEQVMEEEEGVGDGVKSRHFAGGEGRTVMRRIINNLTEISKGSVEPKVDEASNSLGHAFRRTPGPIFLPKHGTDIFSISRGWSAPDCPFLERGKIFLDARFPRGRDQEFRSLGKKEVKRIKTPTAELTIPKPELRRLRLLSLELTHSIKIGRLGVTNTIVGMIHKKWCDSEVVKVKCEGPLALNVNKTYEDLERKTGGLVVWEAGSVAVVYRGKDYNLEETERQGQTIEAKPEDDIWPGKAKDESLGGDQGNLDELEKPNDIDCQGTNGVNPASRIAKQLKDLDKEYVLEVENVLAELGPRCKDWPGQKPIPVDADLLPAHIPDYKPPFRFLPYGVRPIPRNSEMTALRRLAHSLPPHFAVGRNKVRHGLAVAIVKLWEKSKVAKIFVKRGVQNTDIEIMAEELKRLTGGLLLSKNKFYITLYRGKNFLPKALATALAEREALAKDFLEEEERTRAETSIPILADSDLKSSTGGALAGTLEARTTLEIWMSSEEQKKLQLQAAKARRLEQMQKLERKLDAALKKKKKIQKWLEKGELFMQLSDPPVDRGTITEEERFMLRKLGLKMKAFLLIGRRGMFDGIVENMHLHWKHRQLVKVILKVKDPEVVEETARMLEYESGGILVAVVPTSKGQAIIIYRGQSYQRPPQLRPKNLLTKRKALKRSMEIQRRESLNRHILDLEKEIDTIEEDLSRIEELEQAQTSRSLNVNNVDANVDELQNCSKC